jgi:hypothetical protein
VFFGTAYVLVAVAKSIPSTLILFYSRQHIFFRQFKTICFLLTITIHDGEKVNKKDIGVKLNTFYIVHRVFGTRGIVVG